MGWLMSLFAPRWEYLIERLPFEDERAQTRLDELGNNRWELTGFIPVTQGVQQTGPATIGWVVIFKRAR